MIDLKRKLLLTITRVIFKKKKQFSQIIIIEIHQILRNLSRDVHLRHYNDHLKIWYLK